MRIGKNVAMIAAGILVTACSATPTVTKQVTTMTPKQIAEAGLVCKQLVPIDSNIPRTICASERSWSTYDERTRTATDELLSKGRELPNAGGFNRN